MSDEAPDTTGSGDIPMPRTKAELDEWARRLSNLLKERGDHNAARDEAVEAVLASFAKIDEPRAALIELYTAGITRYVFEREAYLKKKYGDEFAVGSSTLTFLIARLSVSVRSNAELVRSLEAAGRKDLVRYEPRPDKVKLIAEYTKSSVRAALSNAGAYVSRHLTASLSVPGQPEKIELYRRRYPRQSRPIGAEED